MTKTCSIIATIRRARHIIAMSIKKSLENSRTKLVASQSLNSLVLSLRCILFLFLKILFILKFFPTFTVTNTNKNNKDTTKYQILLPTLTLHGRILESPYAWLWPLGTRHDCPPCLVGNKILEKFVIWTQKPQSDIWA